MLINFRISNYLSFKDTETFSMLKADDVEDLTVSSNSLLKSSLIFGANASGKSNLISALSLFKTIIFESNKDLEVNFLEKVTPFLLDSNSKMQPTEFEITFFSIDSKIYRYGLSIFNNEIQEEWGFYTEENAKEVKLFERNKQKIIEISDSFSIEARNFYDDNKNLTQTKENVPLISDIAGTKGIHSSNIINWFKKVHILSGLDDNTINFSLNLLENDDNFALWVKQFLPSVQIQEFKFTEINLLEINAKELLKTVEHLTSKNSNKIDMKKLEVLQNLLKIIDSTQEAQEKNKIERKNIHVDVIKKINNKEYKLPFHVESDGTKKLIALLGPMYHSLKEDNILVIDEIDAKFHTLLMKYIFTVFHNETRKCQLIATAQDTNLITTDIFTNDQIWFVDKDEFGESKLYSLIEFKEEVSKENYSFQYLEGAYNAIPLFPNIDSVQNLMLKKE